MKFCWCTIKVRDMEESLKFYRDIVGLPINRRFAPAPGKEIVFLGAGETQVELVANEGKPDVHHGEDIALGFEVESVDAMMEFVQQNAIAVESGPFAPNPHVRFFYVLDPNGLKIQFSENR